MNLPENVFKGDATQLTGIDIDSPLAAAKAPTCEYFLEPVHKAAQEAEEKNEAQKAAVYRFLQVIVGFHPSFDTPSQPFVPMWQMKGKRSLIPWKPPKRKRRNENFPAAGSQHRMENPFQCHRSWIVVRPGEVIRVT